MIDLPSSTHVSLRRAPLAGCLAAILCLATPAAAVAATSWTVNTCDETNAGSGTTGSLRYAAANAISGDTIDMSTLTCSTISLTTGAVTFAQANITLNGPGKNALTIESSDDRVLYHVTTSSPTGTLYVNDLTVANGYLHPGLGTTARGGCIFSYGKVSLSHVGVRACRAVSVGAPVRGGGIYAKTGIFAKYSDITGNTASNSGANANGGGGGIFTYGYAVLGNSTLSGNSAPTGAGGGLRAFRDVQTIASTISGNTAQWGGGLYAQDNLSSASDTFVLLNSTVSGNLATLRVGGAQTNAGTIHVYNSTVAFNTAGSATGYGSRHYAPGFTISDQGAYYTDPSHFQLKVVKLQSSIFSNNAYANPVATPDDIGVAKFTSNSLNSTPTSGEDNLAFATTIIGLPNTLTRGVCPQLEPLRNNGGVTQTHALFGGSPAIDAGNTFATGLSPFDQRSAPYARVSGAAADIGAYEVQQGDGIFVNGFDAPPSCI
ncbi:choice-of-anchor Q domain-containing protein [Dokdonella sp.]|uniref:choice-of-anchor Q domain-containing protein n=1 Tax=Dokdonella sp. TaxID=2291710 RepID=UPI003783CD92